MGDASAQIPCGGRNPAKTQCLRVRDARHDQRRPSVAARFLGTTTRASRLPLVHHWILLGGRQQILAMPYLGDVGHAHNARDARD